MIEEKEARKITDAILKRCGGNPAELTLMVFDAALTRFANNIIHQNVAERDAEVTLRYFVGKQIGTASTNRLDQTGLDELVERARSFAKTSPEDPNYPGLPGPEILSTGSCLGFRDLKLYSGETRQGSGSGVPDVSRKGFECLWGPVDWIKHSGGG